MTQVWHLGDDVRLRGSSASPGKLSIETELAGSALIVSGDLLAGQATQAVVRTNRKRRLAGSAETSAPQGTYLISRDRTGSPVLLTFAKNEVSGLLDGSEAARYTFDDWGSIVRETSIGYDIVSHRFTGAEELDSFGLMQMGPRLYDTRLKRFSTADDFITSDGVEGFNRLSYVFNNPVRYFDPTGHVGESFVGFRGLLFGSESPSSSPPRTNSSFGLVTFSGFAGNLGLHLQNAGLAVAGGAALGVSRVGGPISVALGLTSPEDAASSNRYYQSWVDGAPSHFGALGEMIPMMIAFEGAARSAPAARSAGGPEVPFGGGSRVMRTRCFAPGTQVLMGDGTTKAIESIQVGDLVLSDSPWDNDPPGPQLVTEVHRSATYRLFRIAFGGVAGGWVEATGRHPFWTQRGWVAAEELSAQDLLFDTEGRSVPIMSIGVLSADTPTFNLSVDGHQTYFVAAGDTSVLVHNVDPWEIMFTQDSVGARFAEGEGKMAGRTLESVAAEARALGRLPDGLTINAVRMGDGTWATLNNRTLAVARMANLPSVNPVDAGAAGTNKLVQLLRNAGLSAPVQDAVVRCK